MPFISYDDEEMLRSNSKIKPWVLVTITVRFLTQTPALKLRN